MSIWPKNPQWRWIYFEITLSASEVIKPSTGDQLSVSLNSRLQTTTNPNKCAPSAPFLGDRQEIPRLSVSERLSVCVCTRWHSALGQTPRTCLNGRIKLLGPGTADCILFSIGARNSIIEEEQELWCNMRLRDQRMLVSVPRSTYNQPHIMAQHSPTEGEACSYTNDRWQTRLKTLRSVSADGQEKIKWSDEDLQQGQT